MVDDCSATHELDSQAELPMSGNPRKGKALFLGSMPASRSNALGIQMMHLGELFTQGWAHCYWYNHQLGDSEVPDSHRLSTSIPYRWPFATGRGFVTRMTERLGVGWWRGDHLIEAKKTRLRKLLGEIRFAYVTPIKNSDATRCREILQLFDCPFVVHVWDFLNSPLNADYDWLFSHAEHVFYLSPTMIEEIRKTATCGTSLLSFTRPRSSHQATQCEAGALRIGLVGTLFTYTEGLEVLRRAIGELRNHFAQIQVRYIGSSSQMELIPEDLKSFTECTGFLDDDARDKALAECNVGYLPGPMLSPDLDARSRHSVPSRTADYMAVGLPVIAAVHPLSATSRFFAEIQGRGFFAVSSPEEFCCAALELRNGKSWKEAAQECLSFFDAHFDKEYAQNELRSVAGRFI